MKPVQLHKSREWVKQGFAGLTELAATPHPIGFSQETISHDTARIARDFNGFITGRNGRRIVVATTVHPKMAELVLFEFIDAREGAQVGSLTLLFLPKVKELSVGFFDLTQVQGNGIGKIFAQKLRTFIPAGIALTFGIEENHTKRLLIATLDHLMGDGKLCDWRLGSPQRPIVSEGNGHQTLHPLPTPDQLIFEREIIGNHAGFLNPIFRLLATFQTRCQKIRVGLTPKGEWLFEAVALT